MPLVDREFSRGYREAVYRTTAARGAVGADNYVSSVQQAIDHLTTKMNSYTGTEYDVDKLKGFIFEAWHAGTFNIHSAAQRNSEWALMLQSQELGSPDIVTSWGELYGLKNSAIPSESARQQAKSYYEAYMSRPLEKRILKTFDEWGTRHGFNAAERRDMPIYEGQKRLIPEGQLEGANQELTRKVLSERFTRPEQVHRYKDTSENIVEEIQSPEGLASRPLSEPRSREIAQGAKNGAFDPEKYDLTVQEYVKLRETLGVAFDAGKTAAILTAILALAPEIVRAIASVIQGDYVSPEELKAKGLEALSSSSQAFARGFIAASIVTTLRTRVTGDVLKQIGPTTIGIVTVLAFNTINNALKVAKGSMSNQEFADASMRDFTVTAFALGCSVAFQALLPIPLFGLLLGNLIGGIVGALVYTTANRVLLSFCADTGYTLLGIVDQDYSLPDDVLHDMGLDLVTIDFCFPDQGTPDTCEPDLCEPDTCEPDLVQPYILRRGVIGINRVGFLID